MSSYSGLYICMYKYVCICIYVAELAEAFTRERGYLSNLCHLIAGYIYVYVHVYIHMYIYGRARGSSRQIERGSMSNLCRLKAGRSIYIYIYIYI